MKPRFEENPKEVKNLVAILSPYMNYTNIIYFLEHFPEQANEISFILLNSSKLNLSKNEIELLEEVLKDTILINSEDKKMLLKQIKK